MPSVQVSKFYPHRFCPARKIALFDHPRAYSTHHTQHPKTQSMQTSSWHNMAQHNTTSQKAATVASCVQLSMGNAQLIRAFVFGLYRHRPQVCTHQKTCDQRNTRTQHNTRTQNPTLGENVLLEPRGLITSSQYTDCTAPTSSVLPLVHPLPKAFKHGRLPS